MNHRALSSFALAAALLAGCSQDPPRTQSTGGLPPPQTVTSMDLQRLQGTWYEMGRIPAPGEKLHTAGIVIFAHSGDSLAMSYRWRDASIDGATRDAGATITTSPTHPSHLLLHNATGGLPRELWVLALASDNSICVLATPDRKLAMILNRTPSINAASFGDVTRILESQAYPVDQLQITTQAPTAG